MKITFRLNGQSATADVEPRQTLIGMLRHQLEVTGAKESCGLGMCGACTVLVDGAPKSACILPAYQVDGRELVTIEGLKGAQGDLHTIQEAFVEDWGFQCGFCTPGMILMTHALLQEHPDPSDEDIAEYLSGNICRCGSYKDILSSVHKAAKRVASGAGPA